MDRQHHGVARVSIEGDIEAGQAYVPQARHLLQTLLERLRVGDLASGAVALRLDDTAYAYARVAGSINAVRIVVGDRIGRLSEEELAIGPPDFVSGVATKTTIKERPDPKTGKQVRYLERFYPTARCANTHADLIADRPQAMQRLAVEPHISFPELRAAADSVFIFSQYQLLKPSMYSGAMKRVVQALMGFGRQLPLKSKGAPEKPDGDDPLNTSRTASIYAKAIYSGLTQDQIAAERRRKPTKYEREVARDGLQIRYDYRFMRTHGVHTGPDGRKWLLEISMTRGVLAMPLPLHPLTTPRPTTASPDNWPFRDALEELEVPTGDPLNPTKIVRDDDGLRLLEEFGGFPTGESFPVDRATLDVMIRAGYVLELRKASELSGFYGTYSYYSSALGWAFNDKGTEAHNTGYTFGGDGVQRGAHYAINLMIGALNNQPPAEGASGAADRARSAAAKSDKYRDAADALVSKALRLSRAQALNLSRISDDDEFLAELDALSVPPLATGSAIMRQIREGALYNPGKNPLQQIKFHEPLLGFLVSHDFTPEAQGRNLRPECDTCMHVFFSGDDFKWVRYFVTGKSAETRVEDSFEECNYVGSWSRETITGPIQVQRGYYTSDRDDRREVGGGRSLVRAQGKYLGVSSVVVSDDLSDIRRNYVNRVHRFSYRQETELFSGEIVVTAIAVPAFTREAYYIATLDYTESYSQTITHSYKHLLDPHYAEGWRCIISTAGFAFWPADMAACPPGCDTRMNFPGYTGSGVNPRVARYINYEPYPCSDFADKGPWIQKCDNIDRMAFSVPAPPLPPNTSKNESRKATLTVTLVIGGEPNNRQVVNKVVPASNFTFPKWFQKSPDDFGNTQSLEATFNALGDAAAAVYDVEINRIVPPEIYGAPNYTDMTPGSTYIGVV